MSISSKSLYKAKACQNYVFSEFIKLIKIIKQLNLSINYKINNSAKCEATNHNSIYNSFLIAHFLISNDILICNLSIKIKSYYDVLDGILIS